MSFLEDFQASLELLPNILQRKYALLRDLDQSLLDIQRQNEQRCEQEIEDYKQGIKSGDIMPGSSLLKFSDEALDEQKHAIRIADEKVALAVQAYDLVDAHIQQLDQYLKKYEELRQERESAAATVSPAQNPGGSGKSGKGSDSGRGGRKKTRLAAAAASSGTAGAANANPGGVELDIPVDPNEPTYCFCNGYSFGNMVACDNPTCKIEWFHYQCVGLNEAPKGKWFCSDCNGVQKRRKGKGK